MRDTDEIPLIMEREAGCPDNVPQIAVGFGLVAVEDDTASAKAGHPIFKEIEYFKAAVPGDRQSLYCQPATDSHKQRFPRAYEAFRQRNLTPVQGMPIEQWPQITRSLAMTLRAMHIQTIEALAEVNDNHLGAMGQQGRELRAKAKAFVAQAKDSAAATAIAAENEGLKNELAESRRMIADLAARLQTIEDGEPKRGPGRPRKVEAVA